MLGVLIVMALALVPPDAGVRDEAAAASLFFGIVSMLVWKHRGGTRLVGFLWGFFLLLIGLIVVLVATPTASKRP